MIKNRRVFIFAHCDDELFCLPLLLEKNSENTLIFLSTLGKNQVNLSKVDIRQREALKASRYLDRITTTKILFYTKEIYDGSIHSDFNQANFSELTTIVLNENPDELVTLSYEGGHQDHDSVHLITRLISENQNLVFRCFSGYRASGLSPKLFLVLNPIAATEKLFFNRFLTISTSVRLILTYKSQTKSWIGLAPVLLIKYAFFPFLESKTQSSIDPKFMRNCFYQNRGRAKQSDVLRSHRKFMTDFVTKK